MYEPVAKHSVCGYSCQITGYGPTRLPLGFRISKNKTKNMTKKGRTISRPAHSLLSYFYCVLLSVTSQANLAALVCARETQEGSVAAVRVMASTAFNHRLTAWNATVGTGVEREVVGLIT